MIQFQSIKWKNFLSTGNNWLEVDLNRSLNTLIVGENGSGKSTILDALTFSLFGKPFRKINKPQLCNSINNGECLVEVCFTIGKHDYIVSRGIKPAVFTISIDGQEINQTAHSRDGQEILENQILKLNYKSFTQVVVLGSSTFVPFMQLPAAHRREVIEDLLDIQIFSSMNGILKQKIYDLKDNTFKNDSQISVEEKLKQVYVENLQKIKKGNEELIKKHENDIEALNNKINAYQANLIDTEKQINLLDVQLGNSNTHQSKLKEIESIKKQLEDKHKTCTAEIYFYENHDECPTCQQDIDLKFKKKTVSDKKFKIKELAKAQRDISKIINQVNKEIKKDTELFKKINDLKIEITSTEVNIKITKELTDTFNKIIEELSEKTDTPEAEQKIEELKTLLKALYEQKEELSQNGQLYKTASSLLKDTGIKTLIIKQYLPIMNSLINKYLASMDFFVNFNLDENFNETIKSRHRDEFSYASFSEGEKMRIDLALLFTWRAVAKLKNSTNTNLLILDEVFDSSLDDAGTQEFLKILYTLGKDQNVFVISHKGDILQDKFNHIIKFEKNKGFSRIS